MCTITTLKTETVLYINAIREKTYNNWPTMIADINDLNPSRFLTARGDP